MLASQRQTKGGKTTAQEGAPMSFSHFPNPTIMHASQEEIRFLGVRIRRERMGDDYRPAIITGGQIAPEIPYFITPYKEETMIDDNAPLFDDSARINPIDLGQLKRHKYLSNRSILPWMQTSSAIPERTWLADTLPSLINVLMKIRSRSQLLTCEVNALYTLLVKGLGNEVATENEFASIYGPDPTKWPSELPKSIISQVKSGAKYVALGIKAPTSHWISFLYEVNQGSLWFFDSLEANRQYKHRIFRHFKMIWTSKFFNLRQDPRRAYDASYFFHRDYWSCGIISILSLAEILHSPNAIENLPSKPAKIGSSYIDYVALLITRATGLRLSPSWTSPNLHLRVPAPNPDPAEGEQVSVVLGDEEAEVYLAESINKASLFIIDAIVPRAPPAKAYYDTDDGIIPDAQTSIKILKDCKDIRRRTQQNHDHWRGNEARHLVNAVVRSRRGWYLEDTEVLAVLECLLYARSEKGTGQILIEEPYGYLMEQDESDITLMVRQWDLLIVSNDGSDPQLKGELAIFGYTNGNSHWGVIIISLKDNNAYLVDSLNPGPATSRMIFDKFRLRYHIRYPNMPKPTKMTVLPCYRQRDSHRCGLISPLYLYFLLCNPVYLKPTSSATSEYRVTRCIEDIIQRYVGVKVTSSGRADKSEYGNNLPLPLEMLMTGRQVDKEE
ncbi:hypothetical protein F5B22DRAFT_649438 [Xylaria bambusicola]|uniref:uncharacterized protein n=1 Tax=Xylaria bambusicola TaxID=326684 RepID=UPI00200828A1|nr:uncharacterized protein F5B22DRAFT_649438 [Xylaria bambusicola]KAI0508936.1 hypothetical protein F5B22DRAFT_649438 [Xylaria bambusicola]